MKRNIFKKILKVSRGFTLVEAMVAISILLLSITGAFAVAQSSLQSTSYAKNRITAYYLAQEGLEYIRHLRDNNGLKMLSDKTGNISWLEGFAENSDDPCYFWYNCMVDTTGEYSPNPERCDDHCPNLLLNTSTGQFQYVQKSSTVDSGFKRIINIRQQGGSLNGNNEIVVVSTVSWNQNGVSKTLEVSENLYNWQQIQPL